MGEVLLLVVVFVAGALAGGGLSWWYLRRTQPAVRPPAEQPAAPQESEVSQLASASRQLMAELETRYQGRTASDEGPKRAPAKRRRKAP
jgi:uncharacterized membrane protein